MNILSSVALASHRRSPWALLLISALALETIALFFQYAMGLEPCIMCIYQRNAVFGIALAALVGLSMPDKMLPRLLGLIGWGISAIWGLLVALEHVEIQSAPNPFFASCEIVPNFPAWLPLHEWLPAVFAATGDCGNIDWSFIGMSMPQWMILIFAGYSLAWLVVLIAQFTHKTG